MRSTPSSAVWPKAGASSSRRRMSRPATTTRALSQSGMRQPQVRETYRRLLGDMVVGYLAGNRPTEARKSSGCGPDCRGLTGPEHSMDDPTSIDVTL
jgi:hypothetical protein